MTLNGVNQTGSTSALLYQGSPVDVLLLVKTYTFKDPLCVLDIKY